MSCRPSRGGKDTPCFEAPNWSARVSFANLNDDAYEGEAGDQPIDIAPQNRRSVGSMVRMSRPIIRKLMTGAMLAIMKFIEMSSGTKL
jgi:hypothetical protein